LGQQRQAQQKDKQGTSEDLHNCKEYTGLFHGVVG